MWFSISFEKIPKFLLSMAVTLFSSRLKRFRTFLKTKVKPENFCLDTPFVCTVYGIQFILTHPDLQGTTGHLPIQVQRLYKTKGTPESAGTPEPFPALPCPA
jgi:hypothetical protein